jgi:hypothetical protein
MNKNTLVRDMKIKMGLNRIEQDFEKSLNKNQKIIFNEMNAEERKEFEYRK